MKKIKMFENYWEDQKKEREEIKKDQVKLMDELFNENPMFKEHDLYMFVGRDEFKEDEDGRYTKSLEIEKMIKITPDENSLHVGWGLSMRAQIQGGKVYHIWLPKEIEELVSDKDSNQMEPWLIDLINKHKQTQGKKFDVDKRLKDIRKVRTDVNKYNL